jgi:hypothetical protein
MSVTHACHWLQINGLWAAVISWFVFTGLTALLVTRPYLKHKRVQADIADRLNARTPGGLHDIALLLETIVEKLDGDEQ